MLSRSGVLLRCALAVALFAGFYLIVIAAAGFLAFVPWAEWHFMGVLHLFVLFPCLSGALALLGQIVPRTPIVLSPGPELAADEHPELYRAFRAVAEAAGERLPDRMFLSAEPNASVGDVPTREGTKRTIVVGLPLVATCTVSELQAIVAHELGHHAGDTALLRWVALLRPRLAEDARSIATFRLLFVLYARVFLAATRSLARQIELEADRFGAAIMGAEAMRAALERTERALVGHEPFVEDVLREVVAGGFRPPYAEGFARFLAAPRTQRSLDKAIERHRRGAGARSSTHPPIELRFENLADSPQEGKLAARDARPAIELLRERARFEAAIVARIAGSDARKLPEVSWAEAGTRALLPKWERCAGEWSERLRGLTPRSLPEHASDLEKLGKRFPTVNAEGGPRETARTIVGSALVALLVKRGFSLEVLPGETATLRRGELTFTPFTSLDKLASEKLSVEEWIERCEKAEIADEDLGGVAPPVDAPPPAPEPKKLTPAQEKLAQRKFKRPGYTK